MQKTKEFRRRFGQIFIMKKNNKANVLGRVNFVVRISKKMLKVRTQHISQLISHRKQN